MKEYIKPMMATYTYDRSYVNEFQLMDNVNEVIEYLNGLIDVGILPVPEGYKYKEEDEE